MRESRNSNLMWRKAFWSAVLLAFNGAASAATVALTPVSDTALFEQQPDFNFGWQQDLPAGTVGPAAATLRSRLLLRFELASAVPSNAVLRSASLRLTVTRVPDGTPVNSTFALHRMLRPWIEGEKEGGLPGGAQATAGEPTWNARSFPDEAWGQPGGESGIDYSTDVLSSERIQGAGEYVFEFGQAQMNHFEEWRRNPESNFGWILLSQAEAEPKSARRFGSREHSQPATRPTLVLDYDLPSISQPTITGISVSTNQNVVVRFTASANTRYRLEATPTIVSPVWQPVTEFLPAPAAGEMSLQDTAVVAPRRFYRVAGQQ